MQLHSEAPASERDQRRARVFCEAIQRPGVAANGLGASRPRVRSANRGNNAVGPSRTHDFVYFDCVYQVWSCFLSGGKRLRFFQE